MIADSGRNETDWTSARFVVVRMNPSDDWSLNSRRARETEALAAAAANLSTRAELATFVARLRWAIEDGRRDGGDDAIAHDLAALEAWLHTADIPEEPRWRTLAKALLAATARRRER